VDLNPKSAQRDQIGHPHHEFPARGGISLSSACQEALTCVQSLASHRKKCSVWFFLSPSPPDLTSKEELFLERLLQA